MFVPSTISSPVVTLAPRASSTSIFARLGSTGSLNAMVTNPGGRSSSARMPGSVATSSLSAAWAAGATVAARPPPSSSMSTSRAQNGHLGRADEGPGGPAPRRAHPPGMVNQHLSTASRPAQLLWHPKVGLSSAPAETRQVWSLERLWRVAVQRSKGVVATLRSRLFRRLAAAVTLTLTLGLTTTAGAVTFSRGDDGKVQAATDEECPTIGTPAPFEAWFNIADMEQRGFVDPRNNAPWEFSNKMAQVICGAAPGSEIKIGMFFIRAIGTMTATGMGERPESDPEVIYDALEWVKVHRGVSIGLILDGGDITPTAARNQIIARLKPLATLTWCATGCFNTNAATVYPFAINHEKFLTISDTTWANAKAGPHPAILSMSGNFARSQLRNYHQEVTLIYDDVEMFRQFDLRYDGMRYCATSGCSS